MKKQKDNEFLLMYKFLGFGLLLTVGATLLFNIIPILFRYSLYGQESFWEGVLVNLHNTWLDFLILGIFLNYFFKRLEERRKIQQYYENIDDFRFWYKEEATSKLVANIRRLNEKGLYKIDLSKCYLKGAYLKETKLIESEFMGSNLEQANLRNATLDGSNFKGVNLRSAELNGANIVNGKLRNIHCYQTNFQGVNFSNSDFKNAELVNSNFKNANFKNSDFEGAIFDNSCFEQANLIGAVNINIQNISRCLSLKNSKLDQSIKDQIKLINPSVFA